MSKSIFPSKTAIETVRDNGYNDTASAISELIDNSIDAKSKNIQILVFEKTITKANRPMKEISKIVIVDDGKGMNVEEMETSLQFGNGTKSNNTDDEIIGKFGIGLPNASVSQCKKVEVYSWQKNSDLYTYLDVDEIVDNEQETINDIIEKKLPDEIKNEISPSLSGTAIIWSKCDNLDIARGETLYRRMSKKLCRVFRHYLDHKTTFQKNVNMTYKVVNGNFEKKLLPNDPLYLTTPNNVPGYENEQVMELKSNDNDPREGKIELTFFNKKTNKTEKSDVIFRFSYIKDSIWEKETDKISPFQNHLKNNQGISFVRNGREIDFGNFGYFSHYEPRDRYWGCEIRFDNVLDKVFGVSNDKQGVRKMGPLTPEIRKDSDITDEDVENIPNLKLREAITKRFFDTRSKYLKQLTKKAVGSRSVSSRSPSIADRIFKKRKILTRTSVIAKTKTQEEIDNEYKEKLQKIAQAEGRTLSEAKLKQLIEENKKLEVNIDFNSWLGSEFFSIENVGKTSLVNINLDHKFYTKLYQSLQKELDKTNVEIVDLLLMAYTRVEDELAASSVDIGTFVKIREKWGQILTELLEEQDNTTH
jgi:hypothetical protein